MGTTVEGPVSDAVDVKRLLASVETFTTELAVLCSVILSLEADVLSRLAVCVNIDCELHVLSSAVLLSKLLVESADAVTVDAVEDCWRATRARKSIHVRVMTPIHKWAISTSDCVSAGTKIANST